MDKGHGWGFIILLFCALGIATYFLANKFTQDNTYQKGSVDKSSAISRGWFSPDLFEIKGCDYIKPDGQPLKLGEKHK